MENILIECSQRETNRFVYPNPGEYVTPLAKPVFLYPGDELAVSKTFLDTQAQSDGVIDIEPDKGVDVYLEWCLYSTAWAVFNYQEQAVGTEDENINDNVDYIWGKISRKGSEEIPKGMIHITQMSVYRLKPQEYWGDPTNDPSGAGSGGTGHGAIDTRVHPVIISYKDILGNTQEMSVDVPLTIEETPFGFKMDVFAQESSINLKAPFNNVSPNRVGDGGWGINFPSITDNCIIITDSTTTQHGCPKPPIHDIDGESEVSKIACMLTIDNPAKTDILFQKDNFTPASFHTTFNIPQGKYLPDDLCDFINNELDTTGTQSSFTFGTQSENQMLFNSDGIAKAYAGGDPDDGDFAICSEANSWTKTLPVNHPDQTAENFRGLRTMRMKPGRWIGTNQVEMLFDKGDNKFYWNYLHFPIYAGDATSTGYVSGTDPKLGGYIANARKNGGIFFTKLSASTKVLQPQIRGKGEVINEFYDFWSDKLGFKLSGGKNPDDPDVLIPNTKTITGQVIGTTNIITAVNYAIKDGQHTTTATTRLDQMINKPAINDATSTKNFQIVPSNATGAVIPGPEFPLKQFITSEINNPVKAFRPAVSGVLLDTGYYLLEINAGITNLIMDSSKTYRNISGIINRYFSLGSYTSTGMDTSLVYTHSGEPIALSDIQIRVLNPDKTPASIGFDNTIFLEVNRGQIAKQLGQTQAQEDVGQAPE